MTTTHAHGIGAVRPVNWAYDRAPMIVYWELTNACGLACRHCRATAMPDPAPGEFSLAEIEAHLESFAAFGEPRPHVVFTGGDPLKRGDLRQILHAAARLGIGASLAPAVTPLLTRERMAEFVEDGVQAISLSLDGSTAALHDGLRGVPGTFDATMQALDDAASVGIPVQVNTLVTDVTAADLPAVYDLLKGKTLQRWSLFFLISVGRGNQLQEMTPGKAEQLMVWLGRLARDAPFQVKTTEAMQYRRIAAQAALKRGLTPEQIEASPMARGYGIRDGNGIVFISHLGDVTPSGFLPIAVGNLRDTPLPELYRDAPLMKALRTPSEFKGRCGVCEFNLWCGGSRARAYAWTGDPLETDPLCPYQPKATL
ncbi:MAG: TIGR04053 family radical SAM/SPASM domain-containing protein [Propionibacteriaceae bacterium]|uniref:TIGR04053 family radical SAM/SPASM domain-containing protein n=1 Tax=Gordonia sp. (in: high G+C Gram-positive bacteria) TaxID=84139 RepID=UPI000E94C783|nr:TIGR04053 family radical SAM/SPASM domain-containing protein [Gordonia sp. (in: high G+C Gram-positive bacteria)]MBK9159878.1 TIGR04053 family radical SAM/SPASM domain-containing protein [Micropruina sp.]HBX80152.1 radical SAM/SPASM domain-containing protein [Propionibacteriaceae bacterium]